MEMKQIASIVNDLAAQYVGESPLVTENLDGVVDIGDTITNKIGFEQFTNSIVDKVGKTIMVSRQYDTSAPDIMHRGTGIPYGSITEKIRVKLPKATNNDSWAIGQTWTAGQGWNTNNLPTNDNANPFITVRPEVEATYFNGGATFEVDMTYPTIQNRSGFKTAAEWRRFFDVVENRIFQSKAVYKDSLTMTAIDNFIGEKLVNRNAIVDLLAMYNTAYSQTLTAAKAIYDKAFLRYAGYIIGLYTKRLRKMSRLYNAAGYDTFTPADRLRIVTLDMFSDAIETFMQSDTFHDNLVGLKNAFSTVTSWQGNGDETGVDFETAASLDIVTASGADVDTATGQAGDAPETETPFYIVGTMFDVEAVWQDYDNPRTTSQYNARKEQTTYFYKEDVHYCNDLAENGVVFTLGMPTDASA